MDWVRLGRGLRALRLRRHLRQQDVADATGCSRALIGRAERGGGDRLTGRMVERIAATLGARAITRLEWNGEALDRLLDQDHAAVVETVLDHLRRAGWEAIPEATFSVFGERGSIDILAWRESSRTLLVIEVKTVVPDIQAMIGSLDRKGRLAPRVALDHGWDAASTSTLLVIADTRTSRRRVARHAATFDARFPDRIVEIRRFIAGTAGAAIHGLWFLSAATQASARHRVRRSGRSRRA